MTHLIRKGKKKLKGGLKKSKKRGGGKEVGDQREKRAGKDTSDHHGFS